LTHQGDIVQATPEKENVTPNCKVKKSRKDKFTDIASKTVSSIKSLVKFEDNNIMVYQIDCLEQMHSSQLRKLIARMAADDLNLLKIIDEQLPKLSSGTYPPKVNLDGLRKCIQLELQDDESQFYKAEEVNFSLNSDPQVVLKERGSK